MQYKISKQFAKDSESSLAEFNELNNARLFIDAKISSDETKNVILIYRLFDNEKLLNEFNKDKFNIPIARAQYAEGYVDLPQRFASPFNVMKKSDIGNILIGKFCAIDDAKIFIEAKLLSDKNQTTIFLIFNGEQYVETIDHATLDLKRSSQGSQGREKKVAFRPTPLATTLRLGPPKWVVDEEDEDNHNEK